VVSCSCQQKPILTTHSTPLSPPQQSKIGIAGDPGRAGCGTEKDCRNPERWFVKDLIPLPADRMGRAISRRPAARSYFGKSGDCKPYFENFSPYCFQRVRARHAE